MLGTKFLAQMWNTESADKKGISTVKLDSWLDIATCVKQTYAYESVPHLNGQDL